MRFLNVPLHVVFLQGVSELPEVKFLYFQTYSIKENFFENSKFNIWQLWCPLKEKAHTVPHLKALISGEESSSWQGHIRTFKYHVTLSGTLWKSTHFASC